MNDMHKSLPSEKHAAQRNKRPRLSAALREVAKKNLEEFKSQSDEAFLIRAEMDRKLRSLF